MSAQPKEGQLVNEAPPLISDRDREALREAVKALECESFVARLAALAGRPTKFLGPSLPASVAAAVSNATERALMQATRVALVTIASGSAGTRLRLHRVVSALSGAAGGALGIPGLLIELPLSTIILLRAIAHIAQSEGEDLSRPEAALACLEVFALGGRAGSELFHESGYFTARAALARSLTEFMRHFVERGSVDQGASAVVRFVSQIASRFGFVVSQKIAAQGLPIIGALGGAAVNAAYMHHFQNLARGHFIVRRLERTYGMHAVRVAYEGSGSVKPRRAQ